MSRASSGSSASGNDASTLGDYTWKPNDPLDRRGMSSDGRFIVFSSRAENLAPGQVDANLSSDVFRYDRQTETTTLISHKEGSTVVTAAGSSVRPMISQDGCTVAFESTATDLVAGQTGSLGTTVQLFVYDCGTGAISLVSHIAGSPTNAPNSSSGLSDLSADGTVVLFGSGATDLIAGGNIQGTNLYIYDRAAGQAQLVTHTSASATTSANGGSSWSRISADGAFVAFVSIASDLVGGFVHPGSPSFNTFIQERATGVTQLVSAQSGSVSTAGNGNSVAVCLSTDGRFVAFVSTAPNLVPGQIDGTAGLADVFLYDRLTSATTLVSRVAGTTTIAGDRDSYAPAISADGRYVTFESAANSLVAGFVEGNFPELREVYLFDRMAGTNTLVSHRSGSPLVSANREATGPIISSDGTRVLYRSIATDLVAGQLDANHVGYHAFLFDRAQGSTRLVSHASASALRAGNGNLGGDLALSADGRYAAFGSYATDIVALDTNGAPDVFLFGPAAGLSFHTVEPCRAIDTRGAESPHVDAGATRNFVVRGRCGIPATAEAVAINLTAISPTTPGFLTVFAAGQVTPGSSSGNFIAGQVRANNATVSLGVGGKVSVFAGMAQGQVDVVIDVVGYFQ